MTHKDLYKDRLAEASEQFARNQLNDVHDAVSETLRLWRDLYDKAELRHTDRLLGAWAELASATIHYSATLAANYGVFVTAMGTPLLPGHVDSHIPTRDVAVAGVRVRPNCIWAHRVGSVHPLPTDRVSFDQTPIQRGTDEWKMIVDLRDNPQKGMYYFEIEPYPKGPLVKFRDYLDPHP